MNKRFGTNEFKVYNYNSTLYFCVVCILFIQPRDMFFFVQSAQKLFKLHLNYSVNRTKCAESTPQEYMHLYMYDHICSKLPINIHSCYSFPVLFHSFPRSKAYYYFIFLPSFPLDLTLL